MKVFHWVGKYPNFGDDINLFIWKHFIPEVVEKEDDNVLLVGIGTVLSDGLPEAEARVIMGSGAGYGVLPADPEAGKWVIYGLRGPLTTRLLGLAPSYAAVDPAVLLPLMNTFTPRSSGRRIFVPHWLSAADSLWQDAAEAADLDWVDPRQDPERVIQQIIDAELVVAESMHAAIIADAFGVPWVPVICTHASMFKWRDWTASLKMSYRPRRVGPFAIVQGLMQATGKQVQPKFRDADAPRQNGQAPSQNTGGGKGVSAARGRGANMVLNLLQRVPRPLMVALVASRLRALAAGKGTLSDRRVLQERQTDLLERLDRLREDYLAGAFDKLTDSELSNRQYA